MQPSTALERIVEDLVLALVRSPVVRVEAFGIALMGPHEDAVQARLTFENGCTADLTASRIHPTAHRSATIWTASRCVTVDYSSREVTSYSPSSQLLFGKSPVELASQPGADLEQLRQEVFGTLIEVHKEAHSSQDALTAELQEFVDCVRQDSVPTVTGAVALEALSVADRILEIVQPTADWLSSSDIATVPAIARAA